MSSSFELVLAWLKSIQISQLILKKPLLHYESIFSLSLTMKVNYQQKYNYVSYLQYSLLGWKGKTCTKNMMKMIK